MKKMTLRELKDFWPQTKPIPGDLNLRTKATQRGHIHIHRLSIGQERHAFYLATQPKTEAVSRETKRS